MRRAKKENEDDKTTKKRYRMPLRGLEPRFPVFSFEDPQTDVLTPRRQWLVFFDAAAATNLAHIGGGVE